MNSEKKTLWYTLVKRFWESEPNGRMGYRLKEFWESWGGFKTEQEAIELFDECCKSNTQNTTYFSRFHSAYLLVGCVDTRAAFWNLPGICYRNPVVFEQYKKFLQFNDLPVPPEIEKGVKYEDEKPKIEIDLSNLSDKHKGICNSLLKLDSELAVAVADSYRLY